MARYRNLEIIALRTVRYSDRHHILSAYSRQEGRLSFLVPAGVGREATRRRALLMPLSIVECTADIAAGRDIHTMRDVSLTHPLHGIHAHPLKASVALFLADALGAILRASQADESLFSFLVDSIMELDRCPGERVANFHIAFLRFLSRHLGIEPDFRSYREGMLFDMADGTFRPTASVEGSSLDPRESAVAATLGRMDYSNMHAFHFTRAQRNALLDRILAYYSIHLAPLGTLTTLSILRAL